MNGGKYGAGGAEDRLIPYGVPPFGNKRGGAMDAQMQAREKMEAAVRELLAVVAETKQILNSKQSIEKYLVEHRNRIDRLGLTVAVLSGLPIGSCAARKFGRLVVSLPLHSGTDSTPFLTGILGLARDQARKEIAGFVRKTSEEIRRNRMAYTMHLQKELLLLQKLKQSEKAARNDPAWLRDIQCLEDKIKKQILSHSMAEQGRRGTRQAPVKPDVSAMQLRRKEQHFHLPEPETDPLLLEPSEKEQHIKEAGICNAANKLQNQLLLISLMQVLQRAALLRCYCNYQQGHSVGPQDILQELALSLLESGRIRFLNILPKICTERSKISVEMCSPKVQTQKDARIVGSYVVDTLILLAEMEGKPADALEDLKKQQENGEEMDFDTLESALVLEAASNKGSIRRVFSTQNPAIILGNAVRLIYLIINHKVSQWLHTLGQKTELSVLLLDAGRLMCSRPLASAKIRHKSDSGIFGDSNRHNLSSESELASAYAPEENTVLSVSGIFVRGSPLFPYYTQLHGLRVSLIRTAFKILTRKVAEILMHKQRFPNTDAGVLKRIHPPIVPASIASIVHRRILKFLERHTRACIRQNIMPYAYVEMMPDSELDKEGLRAYERETRTLLANALALSVWVCLVQA